MNLYRGQFKINVTTKTVMFWWNLNGDIFVFVASKAAFRALFRSLGNRT